MSHDQKIKVLFLCTGNSCRSQMAEAWLRELGGDRFSVCSAGLEPHGVHPLTIRVMEETGYEMSDHRSKHLDEFVGEVEFDYLITVCGNADERCPVFPGMGTRLHWPFEDPAALEGPEEQKLAFFRRVRDQIKNKIQDWLKSNDFEK
ncbi:MAG: arsenate reductase ArsC [Brevefilum sp.]